MKEEETIVLETFLEHVNKGRPVRADSPMQQYMTKMAFEAMKITFELNSSFHTPEEIRKLFFQLTGQPEEETFRMFPRLLQTAAKTSVSVKTCLSIPVAAFRIRGALLWEMRRW